ncbi:MAG: TlpA family protein disulfide reductase [Gemmatimonadetes bacterium]|nr:TlpA family protein disulfide reductase [Gemmatimonadota bacterium]
MVSSVSISRGRGLRPGLVIVLGVLSACQPGPPAGEPVQGYREPSISQKSGWTLIENRGPAENLLIYDDPPENGVRLLFLAGRPAPLTRSGRVMPPAPEGPGGPPTTWEPGATASARDLFDFHLAPVRSGDPLLWLHDEETGERTPVGSATRPANAFLGQLVNTGWATRRTDGPVVFASAVRPELVAFDPEGDTMWVSRWQPPAPVDPPTFQAIAGSAVPVFSVLQFGVVAGRGGLFYVLAAPQPEVGPDHVLVFDADGRLLRAGRIPQGSAVLADARGRVYVTREEDAQRWLGDPNRVPFPTFDLPTLGRATERTTLEKHRGKVVVVNFWASWCAPCREEMPLLDAFSRELDPEQAVIVGLNEDVAPRAGLAFIEELGGVSYESGAGGGRLKSRYNYRGLPYTIVLDRDLRVVKSFYGFGSSIDPIKEAVLQEFGG